MTPSIWQLLIVLVIVLLLFGRGKIPQLMGDMAKGIKSFKRGIAMCDGIGMIKNDLVCKAEFSLILPDEIKKYNLRN